MTEATDERRRNTAAALTCAEVADILTARGQPISRARVWQIETRALRKIRERFAAIGIRPMTRTKGAQ